MGILDIGLTTHNKYQEISGQAKIDLTNEVIDLMANHISGTQLLTLNKVLESTLEKYEVFIDNKIDVNEDYEEINKSLKELFIEAKKIVGLSPKTLIYYGDTIDNLIAWLHISIPNVTAEDLREYFSYAQELNGMSNVSLDNIRRNLSSFFGWLHNEGYILKNPMKRIPKIKAPKRQKHPIKDADLEKLRDEINNQPNKKLKLRDLAIFELLLSSGIRASECLQLNRYDLNMYENTFHVIGKGNKERECYFNDRTRLRLQEYLEIREDDNPALFVSFNHYDENRNPARLKLAGLGTMLREYGRSAGIEYGIHPHRFRHTFATHMLSRGMAIEEVQRLLGHTNVETTLIYAEVNQRDVKHAHQKYSNS